MNIPRFSTTRRIRRSLMTVVAAAVISVASVAPVHVATDEVTPDIGRVFDVSPSVDSVADSAAQGAAIDGNIVTVRGGATEVAVTLPVSATPEQGAGEGLVSLSDKASYTIVPVVVEDGSVAIHSVLNDITAPTTYDYLLDLPPGAELQVDEKSGGVVAYKADGRPAVFADAPWAIDANGNDVGTYYTAQDNTLTQHVDVAADTAFPVVADPWLGIDLVSYYNFTSVSGSGWRLNVGPTPWARSFTGSVGFAAVGAAGWDELSNKMTAAQRTRLNNSGRDQYICHMGFAGVDPEWNMELWKPSKSLAAWIASSCN